MKILFDYLPIICFFIAYQVTDIYVATGVLIVALFALVGGYWWYTHSIHKMHLVTAVLALIFGGITIWLHDPEYIQMKPTVLYVLFALVLAASHVWGKKPLIRRMMESNLDLPDTAWTRMSWLWIGFFILSAILNTFVAYNYSQATWVNFKMFGMLGLTLVFVVFQALYLARYLPDENNKERND